MADADFEERLQRITRIAEAVRQFDDPSLQAEAYRYLIGGPTHASHAGATPQRQSKPSTASQQEPGKSGSGVVEGRKTARKSAGKKQTFEFMKDLDFYHKSGPSGLPFKEFVDKHPPGDQKEKVTVAVYWLKNEASEEQVSADMVYTAFKTIGWVVPANLMNAIHKAGSSNYLNSKDRDDIVLTTHGENLVEHQLTVDQK